VSPFLPDTNAFSVFFRRRDEGLLARFAAAFPLVRLSAIVLAELEYGAAKSGLARHRSRIEALTRSVPIDAFSPEDAASYGCLRATLERAGRMIGPFDTLIAAQALRLGAVLVTHNTEEFSRVPGLHCEDWQAVRGE
jgi:tRNA(fMet)-specific endonuclease VapC